MSEKDLRAGPAIKGALPPDTMIACEPVERKLDGNSKKFYCRRDGEVVKIRYGRDNGEVELHVFAGWIVLKTTRFAFEAILLTSVVLIAQRDLKRVADLTDFRTIATVLEKTLEE